VRKRLHKNTQLEQGSDQSSAPEQCGQDVQGSHLVQETHDARPVRARAGSAASFFSGASEQYLPALFTRTSDAIIMLDQDFFVRDVNPAACRTLGDASSAMIDHRCPQVLGCKNLNRVPLCGTSSCPLTRALQQGPLPSEELLLGTDPERSSEVSVSVTPVTINRRRCAVLTVRDLSALKVVNKLRSNFVSMVSHELRTPLNSVHGFVDLLLQGHMGELTEEQHTYLGYTQEGVLQLVSIVEDILFMTRSDLGQFEIKQEEVHFQSLVRQVIGTLQPQAFRSEVVLRHDISEELPPLYADPQRIKQVLNNLVANAIKYTPPGGTVTVSARQYDDRFEMISVTDTGYGIRVEDRQHVFERFYQSHHSSQSKMGGYGLGLSIAKLIVEQHGGTISFETLVDKGTTFSFTVPLYQELG
jgi:two-component system phosphate regulon sensor histidine kinase PhoR